MLQRREVYIGEEFIAASSQRAGTEERKFIGAKS